MNQPMPATAAAVKQRGREKKLEIPPGALLFAFNSKYAALAKAQFGVEHVWVMPAEKRIDFSYKCRCRKIYPVVIALLPRKWRDVSKRRLAVNHAASLNICKCHGTISKTQP